MGTLEKLSHTEPWEFLVMMAFGAGSLLLGVGLGGMNSRFLGHNLSCFLVYIWARTYEGSSAARKALAPFLDARREPAFGFRLIQL